MNNKKSLSFALSLIISAGALTFNSTAKAGIVSDLDGHANWLMQYNYEDYYCSKYSTTDEFEVGYVVISGFKSELENTEGYLESVTSADIPDYIDNLPVAVIGFGAFKNCTNLRSITLTNKVEVIESAAFSKCSSLASIVLPDSIETIEWYAFSECTALTEVTIPERVAEFDTAAFNYCSSITDITFMNPDCIITDNAFLLDSLSTIHGYSGSTAEAFAESAGLDFVSLNNGDVNSDDTVDPVDATLVLKHYSLSSMESDSGLSDTQLIAADVNNDDAVDPVDATWILRYYSYTSMNGEGTIVDYIANN